MANQNDVSQAIAKQAEVKPVTVYDFFDKQKGLIAKALPKTITSDRLIGLFTMVIKSSPEIMACSQASLIAAVIQTIQFGLTPGAINHVYLVPFNNKKRDGSIVKECQLILGYKGMIELVNRSGKAAILSTECVYENDDFSYAFGLEPFLKHIPASKERGSLIGVYCIAKNMIANEKIFVYLTKSEIDKVRQASRGGASDFSPWNKWYEEMAKKTAVKRIYKLLPLSVDTQKQISADESIKTEISPDMTEVKDETVWEEPPKEAIAVADPNTPAREKVPFERFIKACDVLGKEKYYEILGDNGYEKAEQIVTIKEAERILGIMDKAIKEGEKK